MWQQDGEVGALCVGDARDQVREQGQFEPLVTVEAIGFRPNRGALVPSGPILLRANCNEDEPEQPEPEQYECAVEALHPHAGEDRSDRRLNGRCHGGELHRDGDGDIDVGPRLRSVGRGQVNDQDGHARDGHVEAEAREVATARGERDGPLHGGESTLRPPFGTAGDHLLGKSGRCIALVALVEQSRVAIDRGELARVRLVRLDRHRGGGRLAQMHLWATDCSVPSLGRQLIRRARLRGVDMPRRRWRQWRSSRGGQTRGGRGDHRAVAKRVPLATRAPYWAGPAGCGRLAWLAFVCSD